jgi:hypothetical protein
MSNAIVQGESKRLPFLIKSKKTGRPLLLTGATFLLHIKSNKNDLRPVISKGDSDFIKTLAAVGQISVILTPSDTNQLAPWTYYAELRITTVDLYIYKIQFNLDIETTGLPDALLNTGISLSVI